MPEFILTARHDINRANGFHIAKGMELQITIPLCGLNPSSLFGNSRCRNQLLEQFRIKGINIPPTDHGFYSRGSWDIIML